MNPLHNFFKELGIDQDNTSTADISKENEVENLVLSADNKYAVTGLTINSIIQLSQILNC